MKATSRFATHVSLTTERHSSQHGLGKLGRRATPAILDLPPARRHRKRPPLNHSLRSELRLMPSRMELMKQDRVAIMRTECKTNIASKLRPASTTHASNLWHIESREVRAIDGEAVDDELESCDDLTGDWEAPGIRIRRLVRSFFRRVPH